MKQSLIEIAEAIDDWVVTALAIVTETREHLVVGSLGATEAATLAQLLQSEVWPFDVEDATDSLISPDQITVDFAPYRVIAHKPVQPATSDLLVTNTALADWLSRPIERPVLRLFRLTEAFETWSVRFAPAEDTHEFSPMRIEGDPRKVVRETSTQRLTPSDLSHWVLREQSLLPFESASFRTWLRHSTIAVLTSLADELDPDSTLVFRGPPITRLYCSLRTFEALDRPTFISIQETVRWVFDNTRELEMRHALYSSEVARAASSYAEAGSVYRDIASSALESAKIAYQLNLSDVSRDSLKAMGDLRKAVSDETGKLSDTTRQIATSMAGSVFAGIGVIAARLKLDAPPAPLVLISISLIIYVVAVIVSGFHFIGVQARIRREWRSRLYRFLPDADYREMVTDPVVLAENGFRWTAALGAGAAGMVLVTAIWFALVPVAQ